MPSRRPSASPAEERGADLIVVGACQDVSITERLLGTVATEVVRRAPCEVLIVRPRAETGDLTVPESDTPDLNP